MNSKLMCLKFQWEKEDLRLSFAIRINSLFCCFVSTAVLRGENMFFSIPMEGIYESGLSETLQ